MFVKNAKKIVTKFILNFRWLAERNFLYHEIVADTFRVKASLLVWRKSWVKGFRKVSIRPKFTRKFSVRGTKLRMYTLDTAWFLFLYTAIWQVLLLYSIISIYLKKIHSTLLSHLMKIERFSYIFLHFLHSFSY